MYLVSHSSPNMCIYECHQDFLVVDKLHECYAKMSNVTYDSFGTISMSLDIGRIEGMFSTDRCLCAQYKNVHIHAK